MNEESNFLPSALKLTARWMPAFGYLFPRQFTLSFFQLSWQQPSSFQLFLGSQRLHLLKYSDKTHILAPQKAFTESLEWLSQTACKKSS